MRRGAEWLVLTCLVTIYFCDVSFASPFALCGIRLDISANDGTESTALKDGSRARHMDRLTSTCFAIA